MWQQSILHNAFQTGSSLIFTCDIFLVLISLSSTLHRPKPLSILLYFFACHILENSPPSAALPNTNVVSTSAMWEVFLTRSKFLCVSLCVATSRLDLHYYCAEKLRLWRAGWNGVFSQYQISLNGKGEPGELLVYGAHLLIPKQKKKKEIHFVLIYSYLTLSSYGWDCSGSFFTKKFREMERKHTWKFTGEISWNRSFGCSTIAGTVFK